MNQDGVGNGTNPEAVSWASFIECAACGGAFDLPPEADNQLRGTDVAPRLMEE